MKSESEEMYFIICNSDGETTVDQVSKEELKKRIDGSWYGALEDVLKAVPRNADTNYWDGKILIIKGKVVCPKPVKVVERFEIE